MRVGPNRGFPPAVLLTACVVTGTPGCGSEAVREQAEPAPAPAEGTKPAAPVPVPRDAQPQTAEAAPAPTPTRPRTPASFTEAVERATALYAEHARTLLCDCPYDAEPRVSKGLCGYQTRADESLSRTIAWERLVPASAFGAHRACWRTPMCKGSDGTAFAGAPCCRQVDSVFAAMQADLHNIVPVVAEIQQDRSNYGFGEVEGEPRMYGQCDFEVDADAGIAEPRPDRRGDVARAYLYMYEVYAGELPLPAEELELYRAWHEEDPADAWELERNAEITKIQGMGNPFVPVAG